MIAFLLCLALHAEPSTPSKIDRRGCDFAALVVEEAQLANLHPALLMAMGRTETGLLPTKRNAGGYCGVMQVHPRNVGISCAKLKRPRTGFRAGAQVLRAFMRRCKGDMRCALRKYSGSKPGNFVYSDEVLTLAQALHDRMEPPVFRAFHTRIAK